MRWATLIADVAASTLPREYVAGLPLSADAARRRRPTRVRSARCASASWRTPRKQRSPTPGWPGSRVVRFAVAVAHRAASSSWTASAVWSSHTPMSNHGRPRLCHMRFIGRRHVRHCALVPAKVGSRMCTSECWRTRCGPKAGTGPRRYGTGCALQARRSRTGGSLWSRRAAPGRWADLEQHGRLGAPPCRSPPAARRLRRSDLVWTAPLGTEFPTWAVAKFARGAREGIR